MIWLLHGALGQAGDWDGVAAVLSAKGHRARAVELWRFLECEGMSLEQWAASFNAEVRAAGEEENVLVGYSMGGRLALHALLDAPDLWKQAVIVSAHPGLSDHNSQLQRMASDAEWAGKALTADWSQFLGQWDGQAVLQEFGGRKESEGEQKEDPRGRLVNRRRAIARSFMEWSLGKQKDLRPRLGELTLPVLWLAGERDEKFAALAVEASALLPQATVEVVPDCGHRVTQEKSALFIGRLQEFLFEEES